MKKPLVCLLACAALTLAAPRDGQALTDAQHKQFMKASEDYRAADAKLNSVWKQLKGKLSPAEFRALLKDQREWISTRREVEAKGLIAQSIPEVDAYTATFTSRARELSERLEKLGAKPAAKPETKPAKPAEPAKAAKPAVEKPAASAPEAAKPAAPAPAAAKPVLTITRPAEKKAEAAKPAESAKPAEPAKAAEPAKSETKPDDKPARLEIGLPYLEEEPEAKPEAKPAPKSANKPAAKTEGKPEVKAQPAKPAQPAKAKDAPKPQSDAAPKYQRATGTPEHPLAQGSSPACSGLQIVSSRHYGNNVASPFVEMILRNDRLANVKAVRVNGYDINKTVKAHQELPKWRPNTARTIALDVFSHTILKDIEVEYADGSICAIDKRSGEKDFTNPYVF